MNLVERLENLQARLRAPQLPELVFHCTPGFNPDAVGTDVEVCMLCWDLAERRIENPVHLSVVLVAAESRGLTPDRVINSLSWLVSRDRMGLEDRE